MQVRTCHLCNQVVRHLNVKAACNQACTSKCCPVPMSMFLRQHIQWFKPSSVCQASTLAAPLSLTGPLEFVDAELAANHRCVMHAGHLLYGAASNCVRTGNLLILQQVLEYLKERYAGREKQFQEEIAAPIKRRRSEAVDNKLRVMPGDGFMQTHALCRCASYLPAFDIKSSLLLFMWPQAVFHLGDIRARQYCRGAQSFEHNYQSQIISDEGSGCPALRIRLFFQADDRHKRHAVPSNETAAKSGSAYQCTQAWPG